MANNICSLSSPTTYGHIALVAAAVSAAVATALFFSIDLGVLPTALIGGVGGGGGLFVAAVLYYFGCKHQESLNPQRHGRTEGNPRGGSSRSRGYPQHIPYERIVSLGEDASGVETSRRNVPSRKRNIEIFADTQKRCTNGSVDNNKLLATTSTYWDQVELSPPDARVSTQYHVVEGDTLDTARKLISQGRKPLILNMANAYSPGGGVAGGAFAQEEDLCRRTNLYVGLSNEESNKHIERQEGAPYIPEFGGIYSDGVLILKDTNGELLEEPEEIAVISVAAYNLGNRGRHGTDKGKFGIKGDVDPKRLANNVSYATNTKAKITNMLRMAVLNGHRDLVLGALGCGAFANPPELVASYFKEVLDSDEFRGCFDSVTFAIYVTPKDAMLEKHSKDQNNLDQFSHVFGAFGVPLQEWAGLQEIENDADTTYYVEQDEPWSPHVNDQRYHIPPQPNQSQPHYDQERNRPYTYGGYGYPSPVSPMYYAPYYSSPVLPSQQPTQSTQYPPYGQPNYTVQGWYDDSQRHGRTSATVDRSSETRYQGRTQEGRSTYQQRGEDPRGRSSRSEYDHRGYGEKEPSSNRRSEESPRAMSLEDRNIAVFEDTLERCKKLNNEAIMQSYTATDEVYTDKTRKIHTNSMTQKHATKFYIRSGDAIVEARRIISEKGTGSLPLVLNVTHLGAIGGGVEEGSASDEALLCRSTTLYPKLKKARIPEVGGIYFNQVHIIKDSKGSALESNEEIAVINMAASAKNDPEKIKTNIRLMLRKAFWEGHTHLIIGDCACATREDSTLVANCFNAVFAEEEFKDVFETVVFAIPDDTVGNAFVAVLDHLRQQN